MTVPGAAESSASKPVKNVQFQVHLHIVPEPRMVISQAGPVELIEAVDELGNSLVLAANDDQRAFGAMGMARPAMPGGNMANLTVHLHRPDAPGKLIKKLRGTADVAVAALRPDPLVIPLAGAAGKTFRKPRSARRG